jgi:hypothetical protein
MRAFPNFRSEGMELRDYFAAKAMQGLIPQVREMFMDGTLEDWHDDAIPEIAKDAYKMADAMMEARKVPDTQTTKEFKVDEELRGRG